MELHERSGKQKRGVREKEAVSGCSLITHNQLRVLHQHSPPAVQWACSPCLSTHSKLPMRIVFSPYFLFRRLTIFNLYALRAPSGSSAPGPRLGFGRSDPWQLKTCVEGERQELVGCSVGPPAQAEGAMERGGHEHRF